MQGIYLHIMERGIKGVAYRRNIKGVRLIN